MRSLRIIFLVLLIISCKQNAKEMGDLKNKTPIPVIPSGTETLVVPPISDGNLIPSNDNIDFEGQLAKLKKEVLQTMRVLGEQGPWKLKFEINDNNAKIDTDLLFKMRFSNLNLLPRNKPFLVQDLENLENKLKEWQTKYQETGEIGKFSKDNQEFEYFSGLFQKGSEHLADKIISETDNFFDFCSRGSLGTEDEKYFPIISLQRIFPEKTCQELYQFYNNEVRTVKLEADSDFHFTSIQALRGFDRITDLTIRGSDRSLINGELDISPLREMKYLELFESGYNRVTDLSPLGNLKRLSYISIYPKEEFKYLKVCPTNSENQALNKFCAKAGFPR